jgi:hypothetical protein
MYLSISYLSVHRYIHVIFPFIYLS